MEIEIGIAITLGLFISCAFLGCLINYYKEKN